MKWYPFDKHPDSDTCWSLSVGPDGRIYASTWTPDPYLMRIWPDEGEWPRVEDLGPATQERDLTVPENMFKDHCGGLTFAGDGKLYYVASRWRDPVHNPMDSSCMPGQSIPIPLDESRITALDVTPAGGADGGDARRPPVRLLRRGDRQDVLLQSPEPCGFDTRRGRLRAVAPPLRL